MKVLITGMEGFIGSNLARYLEKKNYDVFGIDNGFLGKNSNLPPSLQDNVLHVDISQMDELYYFKSKKFDYIINLAAHSSAPMFFDDDFESFNTNTQGFRNILELARKMKAKVIFASTSSLYSRLNTFTEDAAVMPASYYEYSKFCNEIDASLYFHECGVPSIGLRFFSVYGPNERSKGKFANLVSQFMWDLQEGNQPIVYGKGEATRDFTYVDDVSRVIELLMCKSWSHTILNVGTGVSYSINQMIQILNEELGTDISPKYVQNPIKAYVQDTKADTTKLKWYLGYVPDTTLRDGIRKLITKKFI